MKRLRSITIFFLVASIAVWVAGCSQKSSTGPETGASGIVIGAISLIADNTDLYSIPGDPVTTDITATVTDTAGTAISGILVHFTAPAFGSISTTEDTTGLDGKVTVTFNSQGQFGLATIKASVTSGGVTKESQITIGVYPLTGLAYSINLSLDPEILYVTPGTEDSLKVTVRVKDSLNVGIPGIHPNLSTDFGIISYVDTTNAAGVVSTWLNTEGEMGTGVVTASVYTSLPGEPDTSDGFWGDLVIRKLGPEERSAAGFGDHPGTDEIYEISDTDTFYVLSIDQQIYNITVSASPPAISVPPNESGSATIYATVVDENNVGIPGVPITFGTDNGTLAASGGTTDSTGTKTTTYFSVPNEYGDFHVWAVIGSFSDTVTVSVKATASSSGTLTLYSDTQTIYADWGITTANVTALLKDADNQAISYASVIFTSDYGTINSPVITDSTGQASAVFQDVGSPSYPDSALIIAKYNDLNLADTLKIMVAPALGVDHIVLNAATNSMQANGLDSTRLDATVYLSNGSLAPAGTEVSFVVGGDILGDIVPTITQVTEAGTATSYYRAGISTGTDSLFAEVEGVLSNPVLIQLNPGPPSQIDVAVDTAFISVNSTEAVEVTATVRDTTGNLVADGEGVLFSITLGSINPEQAPTINGVATTYISPSSNAGTAWIKAQVGMVMDSMLVTFLPADPAYINLTAQYSSIRVQGGGDTTQTQIYAHVKDASGNYVGNDIMVHFKIIDGFPGGGVNINNHGTEDSTLTSGGIATVVLNAGTNSGPVQIRAWTYNNEQLEISAQQSLVTISAGPPDHIDVNAMSLPEDGGGDTWRVEVSALVEDAYNNEVPDGVSVSFYILPDTTAQIQGSAVTGNENWAGDTNPGVAYTTLTYHSDEIFDEIFIYAFCMVGSDSIIGVQEYTLPIDEGGTLSLSVSPIAWNFSTQPPPGNLYAVMEMNATLKDGHGNNVDGGIIRFQSPKGLGYWYENMTGQSWEKISGPEGFPGNPPTIPPEPYDSTGKAILWLITSYEEAFPDPNALETTAQVYCHLLGYEDQISSSPVTVTFTQSAGGDGGEAKNEDPFTFEE